MPTLSTLCITGKLECFVTINNDSQLSFRGYICVFFVVTDAEFSDFIDNQKTDQNLLGGSVIYSSLYI